MTDFAPKRFKMYFVKYKTAKDFLKAMSNIHQTVKSFYKSANPPSFDYEEPDPKSLVMIYKSKRNLQDLWIALVKATAKKYNTNIRIQKLGPNKIKITFS